MDVGVGSLFPVAHWLSERRGGYQLGTDGGRAVLKDMGGSSIWRESRGEDKRIWVEL